MPPRIDSAKYWRDRSDDTIAIADQLAHEESKKAVMLTGHISTVICHPGTDSTRQGLPGGYHLSRGTAFLICA